MLKIVHFNYINVIWDKVKDKIQKAIDVSNNEYSLDQVKLLLIQGQQTLLIFTNNNNIDLVGTIQWSDVGNDRICYVAYCSGIIGPDHFKEFVEFVKENGGTSIQCGTNKKSIIRLYKSKYKFKDKCTVMEHKI